MVQPTLSGVVYVIDIEEKSYENRATGQTESYTRCVLGLLCEKPSRGLVNVKVYDVDNLAVKDNDKVIISISGFSIEKGLPVATCNASDITKV